MPYLELSLELEQQLPEAVEAACFATGALSVTFSDARDEPVLEPRPGEIRLWRNTRMHALYDATLASAQLIATLAQRIGVAPGALSAHAIADRVWEREWLRDFHAMRFGRRLWVCPKHESVADPDAIVVRLDPGLAFGTGSHASTAMCLEWLDGVPLQNLDIVDYGCGSGVLAIAALKLGARRAYAFDIDPQALLATAENAADNGVADRLTLCATADLIPDHSGVLLANILASTLIELAADLAGTLRAGGRCILSGILTEQAPDVAGAWQRWFDIQRFAQRDGWVSLSGSRH